MVFLPLLVLKSTELLIVFKRMDVPCVFSNHPLLFQRDDEWVVGRNECYPPHLGSNLTKTLVPPGQNVSAVRHETSNLNNDIKLTITVKKNQPLF